MPYRFSISPCDNKLVGNSSRHFMSLCRLALMINGGGLPRLLYPSLKGGQDDHNQIGSTNQAVIRRTFSQPHPITPLNHPIVHTGIAKCMTRMVTNASARFRSKYKLDHVALTSLSCIIPTHTGLQRTRR